MEQTIIAPDVGNKDGLATLVDLTPFCSRDETGLSINQPWTRGIYTYATNGRIIVRVPSRQDVPEVAGGQPDGSSPFREWPAPPDECFADFVLPAGCVELVACEDCEGTGKDPNGPAGQCSCYECDGTGKEPNWNGFDIGERRFAGQFLAKIAALPQVRADIHASGSRTPLHFRFPGGEGILMPMPPRG